MNIVHHYLEISDYRMSSQVAKSELMKLLKKKDIKIDQIITLKSNNKVRKCTFRELIVEMRTKGYIEEVEINTLQRDPIWGGVFGIAIDAKNMSLKHEYGDTSFTLKAPFRMAPIEDDLVNDILYYRKAACESSNKSSFEETCRYYRSCLFSCLTLIEAFINRHIIIFRSNNMDSSILNELENEKRLAERIQLFFRISTGKNVSLLNNSSQWSKFHELRNSRNNIVHAVHVYYGNEIKSIADDLNRIKDGIGGLLELIMLNQGKMPVRFIKLIKYAPLITYKDKP